MADDSVDEVGIQQEQNEQQKEGDPPSPERLASAKALMDAIGKGSSSPPTAPTDSTTSPKDTQGELINRPSALLLEKPAVITSSKAQSSRPLARV